MDDNQSQFERRSYERGVFEAKVGADLEFIKAQLLDMKAAYVAHEVRDEKRFGEIDRELVGLRTDFEKSKAYVYGVAAVVGVVGSIAVTIISKLIHS